MFLPACCGPPPCARLPEADRCLVKNFRVSDKGATAEPAASRKTGRKGAIRVETGRLVGLGWAAGAQGPEGCGTRGGGARVRYQRGEIGGKAGQGDSRQVTASLKRQAREMDFTGAKKLWKP